MGLEVVEHHSHISQHFEKTWCWIKSDTEERFVYISSVEGSATSGSYHVRVKNTSGEYDEIEVATQKNNKPWKFMYKLPETRWYRSKTGVNTYYLLLRPKEDSYLVGISSRWKVVRLTSSGVYQYKDGSLLSYIPKIDFSSSPDFDSLRRASIRKGFGPVSPVIALLKDGSMYHAPTGIYLTERQKMKYYEDS